MPLGLTGIGMQWLCTSHFYMPVWMATYGKECTPKLNFWHCHPLPAYNSQSCHCLLLSACIVDSCLTIPFYLPNVASHMLHHMVWNRLECEWVLKRDYLPSCTHTMCTKSLLLIITSLLHHYYIIITSLLLSLLLTYYYIIITHYYISYYYYILLQIHCYLLLHHYFVIITSLLHHYYKREIR